MRIGIVRELRQNERRVAATPTTVARWHKEGLEVLVESGAGLAASFTDAAYTAAGARVVSSAAEVLGGCEVLAKIHPPTDAELEAIQPGTTLFSFIFPAQTPQLVDRLQARKLTVLAIDCIPRISRAQKVDALSAMANIAGYRAVIEAANRFGSFFTGQVTAAGKVPPARVLVIGAGVAGLAAIAAAKGLGAIVRAFDTRPQVREQVQSLGAEFLEVTVREDGEGQGGYAREMSPAFIEAEMALFRKQAAEANIVVTTALIPGKPAPKLWTEEMVRLMKPGSVVVDLAAEQGGNCELTQAGQEVVVHGVTVLGFSDLPSRMANVASELYGTNLWHLLDEMGGAKNFRVDLDNDIIRGALVTHGGERLWPPPPPRKVEPEVKSSHEGKLVEPPRAAVPPRPRTPLAVVAGIAALGLWMLARVLFKDATLSPDAASFLQHLGVFVLSVFVGWQVVWSVTPALHTPLMSVTNAISGIIVIGGLVLSGSGDVAMALGAASVFFATINVVGGFYVTRRMLRMFRK